MAKLRKEGVIGEFSGKVGPVVIKRYRDRVVVTTPPVFSKPRTEKQKAHAQRFKDAMEYAQIATGKPPTEELYTVPARKDGKAANTVAVSDFFRPPVIRKVDLGDYAGKAGGRMTLKVENVIPVKQVAVFILPAGHEDPAGDTEHLDKLALELGLARRNEGSDDLWSYRVKKDAGKAGEEALTVVIRATDHPGNVVEESVAVEV